MTLKHTLGYKHHSDLTTERYHLHNRTLHKKRSTKMENVMPEIDVFKTQITLYLICLLLCYLLELFVEIIIYHYYFIILFFIFSLNPSGLEED